MSERIGAKEVVRLPVLASDDSTFSAEDMTGPAQTNVFEVSGLDYVQVFASALAVSGTADVSTTAKVGPTSADVNYPVISEAAAGAGAFTQSNYTPTRAVTTSDKWVVVFPTHRAKYMQITFQCASGTIDASFYGGNY